MSGIHLRKRRVISIVVTLLAIAVVYVIAWIQHGRLAQVSVFTGSTVLGAVVLLILLGVRRRIPVLKLGSVSTWTQVHIYTGFFAVAVYFIHVPAVIGTGVFECGLSIVFLLVSLSGVYGLYLSRTIPKRLTAVDGQHRFDRVSWHREQIAETAWTVLESIEEKSSSSVLNSFYSKYLQAFFRSRPSLAYVVVPTGNRRRRLLSGLKELDRYLENDSRATAGQLAALVRRRDDLDYQYVLQLRLRVWLVVHCFFSVALLVGALVHTLIALRFLS